MDRFIITLPRRGGTLYRQHAGTIIVTLPNGDQLVKTEDGAYLWMPRA